MKKYTINIKNINLKITGEITCNFYLVDFYNQAFNIYNLKKICI